MIAAALLALLAQAAPVAATPVAVCDDKPVLMVIAGPTRDRARMQAYGQAIADSGLYRRLGGYYLNGPRELARFEGEPPPGYSTLIVRFPCLANARAFWGSDEYQTRIKPLRLNPSAGDYVVAVYPEMQPRADMAGKVGASDYLVRFDGRNEPARLGFPAPAGLVLGGDAGSEALADPGGGWPVAALLRRDPVSGEAWRIASAELRKFRLERAAATTQVYLLRGSATIGGRALAAGDLLHAPPGAALGRVELAAQSELLLFREPPSRPSRGAAVTVVSGGSVEWSIGTVARDAGAPAPLMIKRLWTDPASGARLHLVKVAPGVGVPWEVHPVAEEGYLLDGDFHLAECLPDGRRDFDYAPGGYFYRPAGLIHSGPPSTTRNGATWLIRTPATLSAVFYPACPSAPTAQEPRP